MKVEEFTEKYLKDKNMDIENIEYIHMLDIMQQYTDEVSLGIAKEAWYYVENAYRGNYNTELIKKRFDEWWKSNQE